MQDVLLGFSGGIDSSACVEILKQQGYRPLALYIDVLGDKAQRANVERKAKQLGVELIIDDKQELFSQEVMHYFTSSYLCGLTPAPCTVCNTKIKWAVMDEISQQRGIEKLATGHYFGIEELADRLYISRAKDPKKDQSYYLWNIERTLLPRILTPMAARFKSDILLPGQKQSMGLCFLQGLSIAELIKKASPHPIEQGVILDRDDRQIGTHEGFPYYTIGQKRGLNLSDKTKRYCIVEIDAASNTLIVGEDSDLFYTNLEVGDCNIASIDELLNSADIEVIIRGIGRNPEGFAKIEAAQNQLHVTLSSPAWAPALGQPVVFYRGNRVVGGGILKRYY